MSAGMPIDGVIGYEVLSRFLTTFDYGNKKVVFHMAGSYTPPPDATVVPIALFGTVPQFACGIDDVPATCTLDTGASSSLSFYTPFLEAHPERRTDKGHQAGSEWIRRWRSHSREARPPADAFLRRADASRSCR